MARVSLPGRKVIPTGNTGGVELPRGFGQEGANALDRFGRTLEGLGGDFAGIQKQINDTKMRSDLAQMQIDYNKEMNTHLIEQEKNPDFNSWATNTTKRHGEIISGIVSVDRSARAKKEFGLWAQNKENDTHFQVSTRSNKLLAENERTSLQLEIENAAIAGDATDLEKHMTRMVKGNNLLPAEKESALAKYEELNIINVATALMTQASGQGAEDAQETWQDATDFIALVKDPVLRQALETRLSGYLAASSREKAMQKREAQEAAYSGLLVSWWDGTLNDPGQVTEALKAGNITNSDAIAMRKAMLDPTPRTTSDLQALWDVQEALRKLRAGVIERTDALSILMSKASLLSAPHGAGFVKEISTTSEDVNAFWDKESFDYIKRQILSVSNMTGILYGDGEQNALVAQAIINYSEEKRAAAAEGKILTGEEMYALSHKVMIPLRDQIKQLVQKRAGSEKIPGQLRVRPRPDFQLPDEELFKQISRLSGGSELLRRASKRPRTTDEFLETLQSLPFEQARKAYYKKWIGKIK